jgi:trimeric autotransporter adhesin
MLITINPRKTPLPSPQIISPTLVYSIYKLYSTQSNQSIQSHSMSAGNQVISGSLSVGSGISCASLTAQSATIPSLSTTTLSVTGTNASLTLSSVNATSVTVSTLTSTNQVSAPTLFVGNTNVANSLTSLGTRATTSESNITSLQSSVASNSSNITSLQSSVSTLQTSVSSNSNAISSLQLTVGSHTSSLSTLQSSVSTLQTNQTTDESNISTLQSQMTSANAQIALRALDSSVVHLTGTETIGGNKTFSNIPTIGTRPALDASTKAASTAYCDSAVSTLSSTLQPQITTLQVKAQNMTASANQTNLAGSLVIDASGVDPSATLSTYPTSAALTIQHTANTGGRGQSTILFPSASNTGSDYGAISYVDSTTNWPVLNYTGSSGTESSALVITTQNDTASTIQDNIIIQPSPIQHRGSFTLTLSYRILNQILGDILLLYYYKNIIESVLLLL